MESRRSARIASTFWIAVEGIDREPSERHGDISATGIYFETESEVGHPGTVQWLHVSGPKRERAVRVMGYVVRRITFEDVNQKRLTGVALAFMPESEASSEELCDFVKHVIADRDAPTASDEPRLSTRASSRVGPNEVDATLKQLSVRSMTLETSWSVQPGEEVRLDILPPGTDRPLHLSGRARSVVALPSSGGQPRYQIEVAIETEANEEVHGTEISDTLDSLFSSLIQPSKAGQPARELSGLIARVRLPTLCSLFELEKMSGRLIVENDGERATIHLREGQIVDIEGAGEMAPRARLRGVLHWEQGTFEFYAEAVERPNTINMSTTGILLDLAREEDEEKSGEFAFDQGSRSGI